ncbi:MAG: hypothetical protein WC725_05220 [Patescibacteria group bacterium]|jgi:hypothetical protein
MQVGDRVLVKSAAGTRERIIDRETKLYWIINGLKYHKKTLCRASADGWNTGYIKEIERQNIKN